MAGFLIPDLVLIGDHLSGIEDLAPSTAAYEDDIHLVSDVIDPSALSRQALLNEEINTPEVQRSFGLRPVIDVTESTLPPLDSTHSNASKVGSWLYYTTQFDVKQESRVTESETVVGKTRSIAPRIDPSATQLPNARKTAKGDKPTFPCEHCKRVFNNRSELRHHARRYEKRPYNCDFDGCNASFLYPKDLRRHRTTHTGSKVFRCPMCPKSFSRKDNLRRHVQNEHGLPDAPLSPNIEPMDTSGGRRNREPSEDSENGFEAGNSPNNYSVPRAGAAGPSGSNGRSGSGESPRNGAKVDNHATLAHSTGIALPMGNGELSRNHEGSALKSLSLNHGTASLGAGNHGSRSQQYISTRAGPVPGTQADVPPHQSLSGEVFRRLDELAENFSSLKADVHQSLQSMEQTEQNRDRKLTELIAQAQTRQPPSTSHQGSASVKAMRLSSLGSEAMLPVQQNTFPLRSEPAYHVNIKPTLVDMATITTEACSLSSGRIILRSTSQSSSRAVQLDHRGHFSHIQVSQAVTMKRLANIDETDVKESPAKRQRYTECTGQTAQLDRERRCNVQGVEANKGLDIVQVLDREPPALTDGSSESLLLDHTTSGRTTPVPPDLVRLHSGSHGLTDYKGLPEKVWNLIERPNSVW